jgi:N-acetylmuramoyl-L-alanine amidase
MPAAKTKTILCLAPIIAVALAGWLEAGPERVSIDAVARRYGYPRPDASDTSLTLKSNYSRIEFTHGHRRMLVNGIVVMMNDAFICEPDKASVARIDLETVINPVLRPQDVDTPRSSRLVVIDPGHGGTDGGMSANGLTEKGLVLDIARRVSNRLIGSGVPVRLTRYGDHSISLGERVRRAKRWHAAIFVSIHINAAENPHAAGFETYVVPAKGFNSTSSKKSDLRSYPGNRFDAENTALAYQVHGAVLSTAPGADRGIKRARYVVIRDAPCPAILIECGFASNPTEARRLVRSDHRARIANGIAKGILRYYEVAGRAQP